MEGKDGIKVNAISPGWIETGDYNSLRPEGLALACLYLTDPENNFIGLRNYRTTSLPVSADV